jgi:CRP-like cAMP-binding protein
MEKLKEMKIFKYLSDQAVLNLVNSAHVLQYERGEKIIEQGKMHPYFYALLKGKVDVIVDKDEEQLYITTIDEGDVFGEAGIFTNVPRTANVIAQNIVYLIRFKRKEFMIYIKENPQAGNKILLFIIYSLIHKLKEANQEIAFDRKLVLSQDEIDQVLKNFLD